jgi:hypothetical protein
MSQVAPVMAVLGNAQFAFRDSAGTVLVGRPPPMTINVVVDHDGSSSSARSRTMY